jgi:hypothetical protein
MVKDCYQCRYFQGISHVHPDSYSAQQEGIPAGWYICCARSDTSLVIVDGAADPGGPPWANFQLLKRFMQLNGHLQIECPRSSTTRGTKVAKPEQMALFT